MRDAPIETIAKAFDRWRLQPGLSTAQIFAATHARFCMHMVSENDTPCTRIELDAAIKRLDRAARL